MNGSPYRAVIFTHNVEQLKIAQAVPPLLAFAQKHPPSKQPIQTWCDEVKKAHWTQPADIKTQFVSASILKNCRVVFNLKGNDYRLVAAVAYNMGFMHVKFIGTHDFFPIEKDFAKCNDQAQ